jgi:hypothetical protein
MAQQERLFQQLSRNPVFRDFIHDIVLRMGLTEEQSSVIITPTTLMEFAKCFITRSADPMYNYEMYELTGDTCLNKAVVMYFYTVLQATHERKRLREESQGRVFHPDVRMVDYFNKLKALYISTKEYYDIASRLGFGDFITLGPRDVRDEINKLLEDSFEAFIGCFEVMVDRYIQPYYGHQFVANFIKYIFTSRHINYHPDLLYDSVTLLKETNDQTRISITNRDGSIVDGYTHIVEYDDKVSNSLIAYHKNERTKHKTKLDEIKQIFNKSKPSQVEMSKRVLDYLKRYPDRFPQHMIKLPPTPEELGIEELCV